LPNDVKIDRSSQMTEADLATDSRRRDNDRASAANGRKVRTADLRSSQLLHYAWMAGLVKLQRGITATDERPVWAVIAVKRAGTQTGHANRDVLHLGRVASPPGCSRALYLLPKDHRTG
jgi:hypothetical protein